MNDNKQITEKNLLGRNIKKILIDKGLKDSWLAEKLNMSKSQMSKIINGGTKNPGGFIVHEIAKLLEVRTGDLFEEGGYAKKRELVYDYEQIPYGLQELLDSTETIDKYKITEEEIACLKTIRFSRRNRPTPDTYLRILSAIRFDFE